MRPDRAPFGVIAALPAEARSCRLDPARFRVCCAGPGPAAATRAARTLLAEGTRLLWSWGTAGSLDAALRPGALVILSRIATAAGDCYAAHEETTARLAQALVPHGAIVAQGVSSSRAVATREMKLAMAREFGGATVDMETAAIAATAHAAGAHFVAVRAVVDPPETSLPSSALAAFETPGRPVRATLGALARNPCELPDLIRLAWWYRAALRRLCHTAVIIDAEAWPPPGETNW